MVVHLENRLLKLPELDEGDTGCFNDAYGIHYPSCFNCPLPQCKYEKPPFTTGNTQGNKNDRRVFDYLSGQIPDALSVQKASEIGSALNLTRRTIYRCYARIKENGGLPW